MLDRIRKFHKAYQQWTESSKQRSEEAWKKYREKYGPKCPRCDSPNLNKVKPSLWRKFMDSQYQTLTFGIRKPSKTLNICRDCGFDWEDR